MSTAISMWAQAFWRDQQSTPERLKYALRIALASIVTLVSMLVLQMPYLSLGLYIIFFVLRDSPLMSFRVSLMMLVSVGLAVALEMGVVILTDNDPMARVLSVAAISFLCGVLILASSAPFLFVGLGFIYCTLISLWELHFPADILVKSSLWLIAAVALTLGSSVAIEYLFGAKNPSVELRKQMVKRYRALERVFQLYAEGNTGAEWMNALVQVTQLAAAGRSDMQELYEVIVDRALDPGDLEVGTRVKMTMLVQLLDLTAAIVAKPMRAPRAEFRERCLVIAATCRALAESNAENCCNEEALRRRVSDSTFLDRIEEILHDIIVMPQKQPHVHGKELAALPLKKVKFIRKDVLTSRESILFGLKLSLCATLCYIFYIAVAWPGISTCCGTVLIVGLSNTGAMKQKFFYRFLGSAVGGLLGLGVETLILPNVDTVTPVVVIVALLAFVSSWVALGRRFSYIGMQIAFSFYLVAFAGPKAPTELAPARDRLIGILIALLVMWVVFDQVWPVRTITTMRRALASALRNVSDIFKSSANSMQHEADREALLNCADNLRDQFGKTLSTMQSLNDSIKYEFGADRAKYIREGEVIFRSVLTAVALFWNELTVLHSQINDGFFEEIGLMEMRSTVSDYLDRISDAVCNERPIPALPSLRNVSSIALESPAGRGYARNVLFRFEELQEVALELNPESEEKMHGGEICLT